MSERAPIPISFDPAVVSEVLHTAGHPTTDLAFGTGQRYDLAAGLASLEIFPEHPLTRITTVAAKVELFGTPPPRVVNDQVVIKRETAQEEATLTVRPDGTVVFGYVHRPATPAASSASPEEPTSDPERPQEPPSAARTGDAPPPATLRLPTSTGRSSEPASIGRNAEAIGSPPDTPPSAESDSAQAIPDATPTSDRHTSNRPAKEQQPRVQLTGRLGRDPSFRTSPRGTLVGRFPLAVHREDGITVWHSVLAFGDRAKLLQHRSDVGEISKGQEVSLVGYEHTREQPTREGGTKTVTEIYAVAVTRR